MLGRITVRRLDIHGERASTRENRLLAPRKSEPSNTDDEMSIKTLQAPGFTDDEQAQLVTDLLVLKKTQIRDFLARNGLTKTGTKAEIRGRIEEALLDGALSPVQIVQFLDEVIPWESSTCSYTRDLEVPLRTGRTRTG